MTSGTDTADERAVRQLIERWAGAVRARNVPGILAHHSPDVLMFDVPPPIESRGIDAYRQTWDTFFAWSDDPVLFDIDELQVTAGADVAFATLRMRCAGTDPNGTHVNLAFRVTVGLRKIDGQWTIVHEHHSIPAES